MTLSKSYFIEDEDNFPVEIQEAIVNNLKIQVEACKDLWIDTDSYNLKCGCSYRVVSPL